MHWADRIAKEIVASGKFKPYWVDDMKTLSGYAHVGSIRGPLIHDLIYRALKAEGKEAIYTFVFNDFDAIDSLSSELKESFSKYMGVPLRIAPSPIPGFSSFAECFNHDFKRVFEILGIKARFLSSWDMYHEGKFDEVIKMALDNSEVIQDIYKKVSGSEKRELGWLPFQVVCERCGKLGTTRVFAWDGKEVSYKCEPKMVTWAEGCGYEGKMSPFGGNGKLPWKVDWPAHWRVLGVTIEGAGKDLASKGGAYDIAFEISDKVFKYAKPYRLPYEHFLIGGRKMSTSKGVGLKANQWIEIVPPELGRFLFVKTNYKEALEFNPFGTMAIPDLFDEYDRAWEAYDKNGDERLARTYVLSQVGKIPEKEKGFFIPRFRDIANYLSQGFSLDEIVGKLADIKGGKIDDSEMGIIEERVKYAKVWLENYAPDEYRFEMTEKVPDEVKSLSLSQRNYLKGIIKVFNEDDSAESLQISLYELTKQLKIPPKDAFAAIYTAFIGKTHGPRAGMLLAKFGKEKVIGRIREVAK
ncbi:lysine--tRNA ligase [Candidatus Woesebacteria bacterium CG22_combo_CG10-13_8_21_14_all_39_10]|uniref:Lysine--tRNA ligase n=4 Tax=Candidatus Woeseibacteriota TaxID=1752722 RepID=A0A2M7XAS9_9BACT|nr:MAG: lysine--tRNA ligase [Candidatus Woesebacteria bacterium CG22_combo_CG10-13_8_21_14_all_39_10]PIU71807.1 MAG: lysine--tRNA ligase [Candidatus Woesebacteria bacterium CG06_land_8_20_14_3_00_39_27]PIZ47719.1 MAG: lysine--tRNA ligase [Candidatus Woesebacteria bacterium CG_4_10_14_0_2_um_filter_39_14]PJA43111.1 MAG: lysine--tRNA ligase [Candidatus Woesebacteria bacterium CG_4_9_14_3_um_filter_39_10]